jgi:hypothetical protein
MYSLKKSWASSLPLNKNIFGGLIVIEVNLVFDFSSS